VKAEHCFLSLYGTLILKENQADARAIVGLGKARINWVDKKLIDVRMLRLSQQSSSSTDLLKRIVQPEHEWQFYPEGAVQYTQEEETNYSVQFIQAQVEAWMSRKHFLKARALLEAYEPIFASPRMVNKFRDIEEHIASASKEQCQQLKEGIKESLPYFAIFVKRYCESWGMP
jgi:hypothetical protein